MEHKINFYCSRKSSYLSTVIHEISACFGNKYLIKLWFFSNISQVCAILWLYLQERIIYILKSKQLVNYLKQKFFSKQLYSCQLQENLLLEKSVRHNIIAVMLHINEITPSDLFLAIVPVLNTLLRSCDRTQFDFTVTQAIL